MYARDCKSIYGFSSCRITQYPNSTGVRFFHQFHPFLPLIQRFIQPRISIRRVLSCVTDNGPLGSNNEAGKRTSWRFERLEMKPMDPNDQRHGCRTKTGKQNLFAKNHSRSQFLKQNPQKKLINEMNDWMMMMLHIQYYPDDVTYSILPTPLTQDAIITSMTLHL